MDVSIDGDDPSNNIFVSCYKHINGFYFIIWHIEDGSSVTLNNSDTSKHIMQSHLVTNSSGKEELAPYMLTRK
ncbi:MAG: hypothetical protein LBD17_00855 [Endomicrobium sp.]|jgi:hypothetical protein|nr:hypothetical protein [Endomicrobium sp.]